MESVIKWSGSKRPHAPQIISYFPEREPNLGAFTFYELFCGSCAVTLELLSGNHEDKKHYQKFVCVDQNEDLINLWQHIKTHPDNLSKIGRASCRERV